jgi:6,7-dimethyl-8-ribityllumazine synthase
MPDIRVLDCTVGNVSSRSFAVVVSTYHKALTSKLLQGALDTLTAANVPSSQIMVAWVPGAWELSVAARRVVDHADAVICLGAVIRGETTHDQYINSTVSSTLGQLAMETGKPVSFGLLTCNSVQQAIDRSGGAVGNKGEEAATAAVQMLQLFDQLN